MADEARSVRSFLFRWRRWLIVLGVLVALRAALPEVLRRVLVSQASQRLQTRVEVGDVDLALYRGGVTLEDVALYSPTPQSPDEPPLVAWKQFGVEIRYLPLLWKTVQLRKVVLDTPRVALDRLANGELNLQRLVPPPAAGQAPAEPAAAPQQPSAWKTGIDRFVLRAGRVRFRDFTVAEGEPLEIAIPDVTVDQVALQPGLYGQPGRARLYVKTEGGSLRIESRLTVLERGFEVGTRVKAFRLPLRRARLYVPGVGWSELRGELDTVMDHALAPGGRNEVRGMLRLRDVAIRVPDLAEVAFGVERFAVRIAPLDLAAHRVRLTRVDIGGASVVGDLQGGDVLPLLHRGPPKETPPAAPAPEPATAAAPWHWAVNELHLDGSKVALREEGAPLEIGIAAAVRGLSDDGEPGRLEAKISVPPGSVTVAGAVRPNPPGFGGTVRVEQLPVHDLARAARAAAGLPPGLLRSAVLGADLAIEAGLTAEGAAPARADALHAKGAVGVDALDVAGPDPGVFAASWKRFAVPVEELEIPGVVPGAPPAARSPMRAVLGAVRLEDPSVQLTRSAEGIVLPPPLGPAADGKAPAPPPPPAPAGSAAPPPDVTIASFVLARGRVGFNDRTVKPFFAGEIKPLDVDARGIRSQGPVVERFTLSARTPQKGKIDVTGSLRPGGGTVQVKCEQVSLTPYNPFVTTYSSYSLGQGSSLSVKTDVKFGKGKYETSTALTLHRLSVKGAQGDTLFKQQFGIPLSMALALLRDLNGNIKLDIPVTADESGTKVGLGTVVAGAIKSAILGAVTSPLKGIGAILGSGDNAGVVEPPPIAAEVGRPAPTPDGEKQVAQLAELLASHPGVGVELDPVVTPADARWLQEQDLRAELEARTGVVSTLRDLPERNARRRIVQALAERAASKPGDLGKDDQAKLDKWLAERPAVAADRLQALARARGAAVATLLRDKHAIEAGRLSVGEAAGKPREGQPAVLITFGAGGD
jgi:hypothetical protein